MIVYCTSVLTNILRNFVSDLDGVKFIPGVFRALGLRWVEVRTRLEPVPPVLLDVVPTPLDKYQDQVQEISESYGKTQSF